MEPFVRLTAVAVPLDLADVETDRIFPSRFLKKPLGPDYARFLFADLRFEADGSERPDFVLNRAPYRNARILLAGRNFGCGSAREGAVYALAEFGIRALIAPSFGDIFYGNCLANGLLAVRLDETEVDRLRARLVAAPGAEITIDLEAETVRAPDGAAFGFAIAPLAKRCLLRGHDPVDATLECAAEIAAFEERYRREMGWLFAEGGR